MTDPNIHIDDTWMPKFTRLRMTAFGQAVIDIANDPAFDEWTFSQKMAYALEKRKQPGTHEKSTSYSSNPSRQTLMLV